ncbi:MAG: GNAT family N-acetyltransferase [Nocardioides sp.]
MSRWAKVRWSQGGEHVVPQVRRPSSCGSYSQNTLARGGSGYGATVRIERVVDQAAIEAGAELFDEPPDASATQQFLSTAGHHLLFAYDDDADDGAAAVIGMVSGVETTHPDKGTEMFLYELGVAPFARKRGIATELVLALAALAKHRGCYGMWVAVDVDNAAALATYRRAGAQDEAACVVQSWNFAES